MPAPEGLLNSLTGHPTAVDQTLGCMTGLFHVFEGHPAFMGRRYSSTRVGIHSGEKIAPSPYSCIAVIFFNPSL
jgi:hypothetical protein